MNASAPFEAIYHTYLAQVWRSLKRLGVHPSDLEDMCQQVFLVVHRKLPEFEARSSLKTWLYGICIRNAADYRKRAHRTHERLSQFPDAESGVRSACPPSGAVEARDLLEKLLAALSETETELFVLHEIEGLTPKEIAEIMDCPLQTAYSRIYAMQRAVKKWNDSVVASFPVAARKENAR